MITIQGSSFSQVYYTLLSESISKSVGITDSRNGKVKDLGPAYFEITNDDIFRIPILNKRAFNPFFALTEFSWLIKGCNSLEPLNYIISNYYEFSDDGKKLNGAYGYRLRESHEVDQIEKAINMLKEDKNTRRINLSMWHIDDLGSTSKDIPCNVSLMFKIRNNLLDMTVINRSNDLYLGVPYNVVIFYLLQCYIAKQAGYKVGTQRHFTDSLHLYSKHFDIVEEIVENNNLIEIDNINRKVGNFNISSYLTTDHLSVLEREYKNLDDLYRDFFRAFEVYKLNVDYDKAIDLLPKNQLGYAGYLWFKEKNNFKSSKKF